MSVKMQPLLINGWTIRVCTEDGADGFDLMHAEERFHYDHLDMAVTAAQTVPRPSRIEQMLGDGGIDAVTMARTWCEEQEHHGEPEARARVLMVRALLARIPEE